MVIDLDTLLILFIEQAEGSVHDFTLYKESTGAAVIRSSATAGLVVLTVEFDWTMEAIRARQIVDERLQLAAGQLLAGIVF